MRYILKAESYARKGQAEKLYCIIAGSAVLLFSTAFIAGGLNAVAGGGSFITFPTLIFTGVPPIAANATNNTAIWVAALASAGAYRQDLGIERRDFLLLLCSAIAIDVLSAL